MNWCEPLGFLKVGPVRIGRILPPVGAWPEATVEEVSHGPYA
jgi:hypothetical protein